MENFFLDRRRGDAPKLAELRGHLHKRIAGRGCLVIGSAPNPVFPVSDGMFRVCVNGSVNSAYKYLSAPPDLTYLNGAIFTDRDAYSAATLEVLRGRDIGDVLIARHTYQEACATLGEINATFGLSMPLSKYDKRVILGEAIGHSLLGRYRFDANVSNGLFMAAVALWGGASKVVLVGFSFNSRHDYCKDKELSARGHVREDTLFLEVVAASRLAVETTSTEIHGNFGIRLAAGSP
jgi:hypothetical protein